MKNVIRVLGLSLIGLTACSEPDVTAPVIDEEVAARHGSSDGERVYEVTLENLTTGQPMSPGVVVAHTDRGQVFGLRRPASEGIRLIAENGDPGTAVSELTGAEGVADVQATDAPIHRIGGPGATTVTATITTSGKAKRLSVAVMLICTNDGFAGINGFPLPHGYWTRTYYAHAHDAGTEVNDELATSIVPPCGGIGPAVDADFEGTNDRTPEDRTVGRHRGIKGVGDLVPDLHGWRGPVLRVTVRRIS